ncbi:hypothetical protein T03_60 [Trichinella britovi]|uniref:Uncharacterized protein n=1 Tax=Trichinella britovi TaxID=45882 RepID=A0A0V1CYH1_TRIBR|nr:hypothetical protein T03_60 [Trichinella britovi]
MAQDTSESPVEACFDYVNVLVMALSARYVNVKQEVPMHKNRFLTLRYANNVRYNNTQIHIVERTSHYLLMALNYILNRTR